MMGRDKSGEGEEQFMIQKIPNPDSVLFHGHVWLSVEQALLIKYEDEF